MRYSDKNCRSRVGTEITIKYIKDNMINKINKDAIKSIKIYIYENKTCFFNFELELCRPPRHYQSHAIVRQR